MWCLVVSGVVFLMFALGFPIWLGTMREHGGDGLSAVFTPGAGSIQEALAAITTSVSVIASIGIAGITVVFDKARPSTQSLSFAVLSLFVYCVGIVFLLYLNVIRPMTGTALNMMNWLDVGTRGIEESKPRSYLSLRRLGRESIP